MKGDQEKSPAGSASSGKRPKDPARRKTELPGQNPKQDDAPDHDVHHDESRTNPAEKSGE